MKIKTMASTILIVLAFNTFAGQDRGGGNVVICRNGERIESIELLDYYEGRTRRDFDIDLGTPDLPVEAVIDIALDRLEKLMPTKAQNYRSQAKAFISNSRFYKNIKLTGIEDSRHLFLPANCVLEQAAVQIDRIFEEDKTYNINQDIWDKLSNINKAGLILHEIIYSEARANNAIDSSVARRLNGFLATKQSETINLYDFYKSLKGEINGAVLSHGIELVPLSFFQNGDIREGNVIYSNQKIKIHPDDETRFAYIKSYVSFYPNGALNKLSTRSGQEIQVAAGKPAVVKAYAYAGYGEYIYFHPNGTLKEVMLKAEEPTYLNTPIGLVQFICRSDVKFSETGDYLSGCRLMNDTSFPIKDNLVTFLKGDLELEFYSNGQLKIGQSKDKFYYSGSNYIAEIHPKEVVTFSEKGVLTSNIYGEVQVGHRSFYFVSEIIDENEFLLKADLYGPITIKIGNQNLLLSSRSLVSFAKNGNLSKACLSKPITVFFNGSKFKNIYEITFDENENIAGVSGVTCRQ